MIMEFSITLHGPLYLCRKYDCVPAIGHRRTGRPPQPVGQPCPRRNLIHGLGEGPSAVPGLVNLSSDLQFGRHPPPTCTAEEIVLDLAIQDAERIHHDEDELVTDLEAELPASRSDYNCDALQDVLFQDKDDEGLLTTAFCSTSRMPNAPAAVAPPILEPVWLLDNAERDEPRSVRAFSGGFGQGAGGVFFVEAEHPGDDGCGAGRTSWRRAEIAFHRALAPLITGARTATPGRRNDVQQPGVSDQDGNGIGSMLWSFAVRSMP
ncbi:hypothetical protein [Saccharopolyspora spinosa]|uniref:hypothetical protein n=1 Tax=Saccharopolyspora spinosa TaxID=60894 RepID=UPI001EEE9DCA|nr:hypothetical protein [Saccharopolyspora spinosa]